jgi:pimeloyl-ACP methyl ester carboxylesterase
MKSKLLFIHGAGGNRAVWGFQRKFFKKALFLDLPGHNVKGSGMSSVEEYVEFVKNFCAERSLKDIVLVGHSMGGAIVQSFALKYPEYLRGIVLVSTGAKLRVAPVIFEIIKKDYEEAVEFMIDLLFFNYVKDEIKQRTLIELKKIKPEVVYRDFEACDKFDLTNEIEKIKIPTLIVCGSEDVLTPVKYSKYLKRLIPNSKLEVIKGAGHMVMLEKPFEFNGKLRNFLEEIGVH